MKDHQRFYNYNSGQKKTYIYIYIYIYILHIYIYILQWISRMLFYTCINFKYPPTHEESSLNELRDYAIKGIYLYTHCATDR